MGRGVCKSCGEGLHTETGSQDWQWPESAGEDRAHLWEMVPSKFLQGYSFELPPYAEFQKHAVLVWRCPKCKHLQEFP
jgi:hypothetical protein